MSSPDRGVQNGRARPSSSRTENIALYKGEAEIARLVLGGRSAQWEALAAIWERDGLPRIDPMTGMRFWPAVQKYLYRRHGLLNDHVPATVDGVEQWP